jgi:pimeloyl-ACP methyl ester carboxylesterase
MSRVALQLCLLAILLPACRANLMDHSELPKVSGNLVYLRSPDTSTDKLVVFVHGLFGDSRGTWTNSQTGAYWPQLVMDSKDFADFSLMVAEVNSPYIYKALTLEQAASLIGQRLQDEGVYRKFTRIFFVGHSMGGLISRRIVMDLRTREHDLRRVAAVLAISTPTDGSTLSELASYLSLNPQTRDLSPAELNSFLQALTNVWEDILRERERSGRKTPRSYCAYETLPTFGVSVVTKVYTGSRCDERATPFERNHHNIVKPADRDDGVYKWVSVRLLEQNLLGLPAELGGGRLGGLVDDIRSAYANNQTAYVVRYATAEDEARIEPLWIGPQTKPFTGNGWAELLEKVAVLYPCLNVSVTHNGKYIELSAKGPLRPCPMRSGKPTTTCQDQICR